MARLIDADALYAKLGKMAREPYYQHDGEDYHVGIADASCAVYEAPTVDAVEVVRCKDCKFIHDKGFCTRVAGLTRIKLDDFCSYGERKE
jgi:hypothetical protein